ncbi:MAG: formylglycine-generating enzyme family protein [Pirellulaceae bacterium]|nr:formylglycine-generating enzyme family protein [Pirellulaceae bacterium]
MLTPILLTAALTVTWNDNSQTQILKTFRDEFVLITPGMGDFPLSFQQGRETGGGDNERPTRIVTFAKPFLMAKYEVPQNLWEAVMGNNPSRWKGPRNSVEMISWNEAKSFCEKATQLMRAAKLIEPGQQIRLPSESEWEYAARAGTKSVYSFGDDQSKLGAYGWFTGNAAGNDPPVGAKAPNAWGLYDMHGYLWEWTADGAHDSYEGAPVDGTAWQADQATPGKILRSGSWKDAAGQLTSSYRKPAAANLRDDAVGLRCVLSRD